MEFKSIAMLANDILQAQLTGAALEKSSGFQDREPFMEDFLSRSKL